jgi:hypothetical protein
MLLVALFILPSVIEYSESGVVLLNVILLSLFFTGIFSTRNKITITISSSLFLIHLIPKLVRFGDNPHSYFIIENIIAVINISIFISINFRLLFRDDSVNLYRIIGAVNVYLLIALLGSYSFEIIHRVTGSSVTGVPNFTGTEEDYIHFIYFSLASLTTVGFGDLMAANTAAKMLAVFLSTLGMLYPAIIIARLVSLQNSNK